MPDSAAAEKSSSPEKPSSPKRHRVWVAVLLTLAAITGFLAIFSTWINRQALNTDNWTNTSSKLLADKKIQTLLGAYLVNEVFSNVDVAAQLRAVLPKQAQALAGPAATGLRGLADREAPQILNRPRVQAAFKQANRTAHEQLLNVLNGGKGAVSTGNGEVVLDLHQLVAQLAGTVGLSNQVAQAQSQLQGSTGQQARNLAQQKLGITLPPQSGKLVIMRSDQLGTAQDIAKAIRHLAILFTVLTFALFAGAIALAAGRRRITLRTCGWIFVGVGVFSLLLRRVGGNVVVDGLVKNVDNRPAMHDAWTIGTSLLYTIAITVVIYGFLFVFAAWLAGDTRPALGVRRALAPEFRDRPVLVYGVVAFIYLLVLLWGPTPAFRNWIPILLIAALIVFGVEILRRQCLREFPDAKAGETWQHIRESWSDRRAAHAAPAAATATAGGGGNGTQIEQLERLSALHERGALTDSEYDQQKSTLLGSS
jgi:hypothetical protein